MYCLRFTGKAGGERMAKMAKLSLESLYFPDGCLSEQERSEITHKASFYLRAWKLAWPAVAESLFIGLASLVDTAMVATMGDVAVAAVGLCSQPKFTCLCLVTSLNVGITAIMSRRIGEENWEKASYIFRQSLILSFLLAFLTCGAAYIFADGFIRLCGSQPDTHAMATEYFRILLVGLLFQNVCNTINAGQRCTGNGKLSLKTNLVACTLHIFFNYLLISGNWGFPALGVSGAAWATTASYLVAFFIAVESILNSKCRLQIRVRKWLPEKNTMQSLWRVANSVLAENLLMRVGFFTFALIAAKMGTLLFAAHQICMNVTNMLLTGFEGFAVAATALVGWELGAKRPGKAELAVKICLRMALVYSFLLIVLLVGFNEPIARIFSQNSLVITNAQNAMLWVAVATIPDAITMVYAGGLRGAGDTRFVAISGMLSTMLLRPGLAFFMVYCLKVGLMGVWIAFTADFFLRGALNYYRFYQNKWKQIQV